MEQNDAAARVGLAIKQDLLNRGINTKMAAKRLGVSPAGVSVYFSGRRFSTKAAQKWAKEFDLNERFLVSGEGHPSKYETMTLSPEEKRFILWSRKNKRSLSSRNYNKLIMEESLCNLTEAVDQLKALVDSPAIGKR